MTRNLHWYEHIGLNIYSFGLSLASGIITPLLLPFLVVLYMPEAYKNTYVATVRIIGLAVAMMIQPIAGMLSDRSTLRWGRRRPFIFIGTVGNVLFLLIIWASTLFPRYGSGGLLETTFNFSAAYAVLILGIVLMQFSSNIGQSASQGLIPDLVPENQRGRSSGFKSVLELLPSFLAIGAGFIFSSKSLALVPKIGILVGIIIAGFVITMLITLVTARETPQKQAHERLSWEPVLRIVALTAIFVVITQVLVALVGASGRFLSARGFSINQQVWMVGIAGLVAMAVAIFVGVYLGAWVGIGEEAPRQKSFIWWVINRLMFLAAVGSVQGFAQYFLRDVIKVPNPVAITSILLGVVALFLMVSAIGGGYLSDRFGRKPLVAAAGGLAALGTLIILLSQGIPQVIVGGSILGLGTGLFFAANWALGTDLIPPNKAGRYLGISNLAGAGAGIVGAGIGGPMADFFNQLRPGLGYLVIFAIYTALFLISILTLTKVVLPKKQPA